MAIRIRHDAAAVALPSTNAGASKYGQSLVLQQQQQKYAGQQAGYDRMFDAYRQENQNRFQWGRDQQQQNFQWDRDQAQNQFMMDRDKAQQQQAEAERQRLFLDEARKQQGGIIMEDIKNGEFDPVTSRKLQQNLVAEAEALGNPQLDATQRAEALQKIRAERSVLSANRQQKAPPPTPQQEFDKGIVVDPETGMRFRVNSKGDYDPLPQPVQEPRRPATADEAFSADSKLKDKYMAEAVEIETKGGEVPLDRESRKRAAALARELWESDNAPTTAPELPPTTSATAPVAPGMPSPIVDNAPPAQRTERSILDPAAPSVSPPITGEAGMPPIPPQQALPAATPAETQQGMTGQGYEQRMGADGKPFWQRDDRPAPSSQNPWAEVAGGGAPTPAPKQGRLPLEASSQTPMAANRTEQRVPMPEQAATPPKPNFGDMILNAKDEVDRTLIFGLERAYQGQPPEVQNAISAFVNPDSSDEEFIAARDYLKAAGIDLEQMASPPKKKSNRDSQSGRGM